MGVGKGREEGERTRIPRSRRARALVEVGIDQVALGASRRGAPFAFGQPACWFRSRPVLVLVLLLQEARFIGTPLLEVCRRPPAPSGTSSRPVMAPKKSEVNLEHLAFEEERLAKWKLLEPRILNTVSALGGLEDVLVPGERAEDEDEDGPEPEGKVESVYRLGDECLGCLKDIKKFWRLDDHDDDRTVARILYKSKVLPNDLLPILKSVEGTGSRGTRIALLCCTFPSSSPSLTQADLWRAADIIAALTWPIDVAAELRESADIDDEEAQRAAANVDYSGLVAAQLSYKRDILRSGALGCIFRLIVPALDKPRRCGSFQESLRVRD